MRDPEDQRIALECLRLAHDSHDTAAEVVARAGALYGFVTGSDLDVAKKKLAAVRQALAE